MWHYNKVVQNSAIIFVFALFLYGAYSCFLFGHAEDKPEKKLEFSEQIESAQMRAVGIEFNEKEKAAAVIAQVNKAVDYFKKNRLVTACHAFSHTSNFVEGEVYLYVMDTHGVFLAHGEQQELIWQNYFNYKDSFGTFFARQVIQKAREGGGWVTYEWRGASKISYVQLVEKNGKEFIIAAGYYPHSKQDLVVNLVKGAVEVVHKDIEEGRPIEQAFSTISYPLGRFVVGDLYLYALKFDGTLLAHGQNPKLVGVNSLEYQDARGVFINKEILHKLKERPAGQGIWVDYVSQRAPKRAYVEKMMDAAGNEYFIACGYYPESNREKVMDLVHKGYQFMKAHGLSQAIKEFSRGKDNEFLFGDLSIVVYDLNGTLITDLNKAVIGQNQIQEKDEDGHFYVKEIIAKANEGGGWIDFKINKSFKSFYTEKVEIGTDSYIIGSAFYPSSKRETIGLLVKSAISYINTNPLELALAQFVNVHGSFIRGDLFISVFDLAGNCYAHGSDVEKIWSAMLDAKDDDGKLYVKMFIESSKAGPTDVLYKINGRVSLAHVERVEKDGTIFVVSSSFQT